MKELLIFICLFSFISYCQAQHKNNSILIHSMSGDLLTDHSTKKIYNKTLVYNYINSSNKRKVLLINKYIDTTKRIFIHALDTISRTFSQLKSGFSPLLIFDGMYSKDLSVVTFLQYMNNKKPDNQIDILSIKVENGQLLISTTIYKMDLTFICKIKNNQIVAVGSNYNIYASDRFIEVYDDHYLPVLQIDLDKKSNTIFIKGLFFLSMGCSIIGEHTFVPFPYPKDYYLMEQKQRDSIFDRILKIAPKYLKPIHE